MAQEVIEVLESLNFQTYVPMEKRREQGNEAEEKAYIADYEKWEKIKDAENTSALTKNSLSVLAKEGSSTYNLEV